MNKSWGCSKFAPIRNRRCWVIEDPEVCGLEPNMVPNTPPLSHGRRLPSATLSVNEHMLGMPPKCYRLAV